MTDRYEEVPSTFGQNIGIMRQSKGTIDDKVLLYSWDIVQNCFPECRALHYCIYEKKFGEKCTVQYKYVQAFAIILFRNYSKTLGEAGLYKVGQHLVPLYKILCKMLIDELGFNQVIFDSPMGGWKANPIYREIRDQIKKIEDSWRSLGLTMPLVPPPAFGQPKGTQSDGSDISDNYYEQMEQGLVKPLKTANPTEPKKPASCTQNNKNDSDDTINTGLKR